jgi:hypothetical protein
MAANRAVLESVVVHGTTRSGETTNAVVVVTGPVLHSATTTASSRNRTGREPTLGYLMVHTLAPMCRRNAAAAPPSAL